MMLPDTTGPMALTCHVEDVTSRHAYAILESVHELARKGIIE